MFRSPQIILFSDDVTRAVAFYSGLGFSESFRLPAEGDPIHVDLVLDGHKIGIASVTSTRQDHGLESIPEGQRAVILWTHDTEQAYTKLTANGVHGLKPPHEWLGRLLIAWVGDPDGNPSRSSSTSNSQHTHPLFLARALRRRGVRIVACMTMSLPGVPGSRGCRGSTRRCTTTACSCHMSDWLLH